MSREQAPTPKPPRERPLDKTKALIVGVLAQGEEDHLGDDLDELEQLLATLKIKVLSRVVQRRQKLNPKCLLGEGKVDEIRQQADDLGAGLVVFDRAVSAPQM